jgi:hypothetical protein
MLPPSNLMIPSLISRTEVGSVRTDGTNDLNDGVTGLAGVVMVVTSAPPGIYWCKATPAVAFGRMLSCPINF